MSDHSPPHEPDASGEDPPAAEPEMADPLAAMTAERDKLKDLALRALADLDNFRKRSRKDVDEAGRKAREDLLRELLPVFDNLERALQHVETQSDVSAIHKGIELVLRLFDDTLVRLGGKRLRSIGTPFDPTVHEAIQQMPSEEYPAGTVTHEQMPGYLLNDRLLRPALVVVSKGPPSSKDGE